MNLGQFKDHIEQFPKGREFDFSISEPFSWRGVYAEVAFTIEETPSKREEILDKINKALTQEFIGWKGGKFFYNNHTDIHFERSHGAYSDEGYANEWIERITQETQYETVEEKLVKLIFPPTN